MQIKNKATQKIDGRKLSVGIVVSRFNEDITKKLLESALQTLTDSGVQEKNLRIVWVAGAMEIPFALQKLSKTKKYAAFVALGCIIRGETPHFDYVCKTVQEGVLRVSLDNAVPVGFGVMTVNTRKQALARIHLGSESVIAALELAAF